MQTSAWRTPLWPHNEDWSCRRGEDSRHTAATAKKRPAASGVRLQGGAGGSNPKGAGGCCRTAFSDRAIPMGPQQRSPRRRTTVTRGWHTRQARVV